MKTLFSAIAPGSPETALAGLRKRWADAQHIERPTAEANTLLLYGSIGPDWWSEDGGITHDSVTSWLASAPGPEVVVRINSPGGDVFEGVGIYNALLTWQAAAPGRKISVKVDAIAASIASVIAMAGDEITVAGNAMVMIHRASTMAWGNAAAMQSTADVLGKIDATILATYVERTGQTIEDLTAWLDAETYMTAAEAVARGFADKAEPLKGRPTADPESAARLATARLLHAKAMQERIAARMTASN